MSEPAKWERLKEIFSEAVELPPSERDEYIAAQCGDDSELRIEVESWLFSHDQASSFIEQPASAFSIAAGRLDQLGKQFGSYRIISEIGSGGMGAVFLAERTDNEFEQKVALKIIRHSLADSHLVERFKRERQILASLNHPNIAKLLDGGVSTDGEPFVAMEFVDGEPLLSWARSQELSIRQKLVLFLKLCSAVAHAHRNLIIHRDIKPANILIDSGGEPKLLDFGVAKLNQEGSTETTATMYRALTPAYASPEQLLGHNVSTTTDVYSLGLVLYELLTGGRPFNVENKSLSEIVQIAEETMPTAPSQHKSAGQISSQLRGDIDNILLMALRKEPERRYQSVDAFAEDIERYLDGRPIQARPNTLKYRASKFVTRNKAAVAAAVIVISVLIGAVLISRRQALLAAAERDIAQQERNRAEQASSFLQAILSAAGPEEKGRDAKVIEVLDDAASRIDADTTSTPDVRIPALFIIGKTYGDLGIPERSIHFLQKALELNTAIYGESAATNGSILIALGDGLSNAGRTDEAKTRLTKGVEIARMVSPEGTAELAQGLFVLGEINVRGGRSDIALGQLTESISIFDRIEGSGNADSAYSLISLGRAYERLNDLYQAESNYRSSIKIYQDLPPKYDTRRAAALLNLGNVLLQQSKLDDALVAMKDGDAIFARGGDSWEHFASLSYLSRAYFQKRDYPNTIENARAAIKIAEKLDLEGSNDFIFLQNQLGIALLRTGRISEAASYIDRFYELSFSRFPEGDIQRAFAEGSLGELYAVTGRKVESAALLERSFNVIKQFRGDSDPATAFARERLALISKN